MLKIGFLVYENCLPTGLFAGLDYFMAANTAAKRQLFKAQLISAGKKTISCAHGQLLTLPESAKEFKPDIVVIPGFWTNSSTEALKTLKQNQELNHFLKRLPKKTRIWSYCTGVLFHAQTGRLNGKNSTITWWITQEAQKCFPEVNWQIGDVLIRQESDMTASGANGFYQIFENAIQDSLGESGLTEIRKFLMVPPLLEKNDPFYKVETITASDLNLSKIKKILYSTPAREISVELVANRLGLSARTLTRQFQREVNQSPAQYFRQVKFKQAAEMMTKTRMSLSDICEKLGYDDEANFRRGFKAAINMTPGQYQKKFKRIKS